MKKIIKMMTLASYIYTLEAEVLPNDKRKHILAGAIIYSGCIITGELIKTEYITKKNCLLLTGFIAIGKEVVDYKLKEKGSSPEIMDAMATMVVPFITYNIMEW